jgi:DNA-binding transcriptional MerR regulator/ABC-type Fe3+-hydroxamate transport system substrate-binding protein
MKTVGEVAGLAGVTVETLRHYDKIGLLEPGARSDAGYRLYGSEELLRLREILVWRLLGFSLAKVASLLDAPEHDRTAALVRQRELVGEQRRQFAAMTRALDRALAADREDQGGEDAVFDGFTTPTPFQEAESVGAASSPVSARLRLIDGPARLGGHRPERSERPPRIVGTDPIRVAESLLAVGIVPVGTGTYESESRKLWPWPPPVEQPIRDAVRDTGLYGADLRLLELAQPDLIIDLLLHGERALAGDRVGDGGLAAVAPTVTVDVDGSPPMVPRFRSVLPAVAATVGREDRVESLLALWTARTAAVRAHLEGQEVSVLVLWSDDRLRTPNERYASQVLTSVGLRLTPVEQGAPVARDRATEFDDAGLVELDAPTLFTHRMLGTTRARFDDLLQSRPVRTLPAVAAGRVCQLGSEFLDSGWFSANWQLDKVARVYGLERLRATVDDDGACLATNPLSGEIAVTSSVPEQGLTLRGPRIPTLTLSPDRFGTRIRLDAAAVAHLSRFPEEYRATFESGRVVECSRDRESALERVFSRDASSRAGAGFA